MIHKCLSCCERPYTNVHCYLDRKDAWCPTVHSIVVLYHHMIIPLSLLLIALNSIHNMLILTVLVATIDAQWEGMGDVGSARYEPALLPPCPTIRVLSYSN